MRERRKYSSYVVLLRWAVDTCNYDWFDYPSGYFWMMLAACLAMEPITKSIWKQSYFQKEGEKNAEWNHLEVFIHTKNTLTLSFALLGPGLTVGRDGMIITSSPMLPGKINIIDGGGWGWRRQRIVKWLSLEECILFERWDDKWTRVMTFFIVAFCLLSWF